MALCFMVWATPRSIISTVSEVRAMGGSSHPILGFLGSMSAKNTAGQHPDPDTFMSFLLYRRTGKVATVPWAKPATRSALHLRARGVFVIFLGVYGYFVEAKVRIGFSVPQVLVGLLCDGRRSPSSTSSCSGARRRRPRCAGARSPRRRSTC
jgi:hypothetical protein